MARKRAELLAKKRTSVPLELDPTPTTLRAKVKHEVSKFLKQKGTLGIKEIPNSWWRLYHRVPPSQHLLEGALGLPCHIHIFREGLQHAGAHTDGLQVE